ncbi:MAG: hypothetical protein HC778_01890 [Chamaesiphon sp. CSU_1_12]|nr:hypothetical protein [Chamaesiphon sp. CSU_1_12]
MMTGQQAIRSIDRLLDRSQHRKLNDLESTIVLQIWEGDTYRSIASRYSYDLDYIKQIAARLWKVLSKLLGENICKSNIKSVLERYHESQPSATPVLSLVAEKETPLLFAGGSANVLDRDSAAETGLDNIQTWMISDRRTTIAFVSSTAPNETSRIKFDTPAASICQQQIQSQIQSLIWQNLSESANSTVLIDEILSVLTVKNSAENAINCLIVNYYF